MLRAAPGRAGASAASPADSSPHYPHTPALPCPPADAAVPLPPPGTPLAGGARLLGTWRGVAVLARPYPVAKGGPLGWEIQQEEMALCAERLASGGGLVALRPASGGRWQELRGLPPAQLGVGCPDYEFFMSRWGGWSC